jgi:ADP-ribose pyrophosphatase
MCDPDRRESKRHFTGRYLALVERAGWEYATRINASAVAVLVPLTQRGELVLVEQYREPIRRRVLELPAGLAGDSDDPEEPIEAAAQRELLEETGYRAGRLTRILSCPSSAGMSDEMITFFLAEDLERVGSGGGDDSEDIEVHRVKLERVDAWLSARLGSGVLLDPKVYAALYWLSRPEHMAALGSESPGEDPQH